MRAALLDLEKEGQWLLNASDLTSLPGALETKADGSFGKSADCFSIGTSDFVVVEKRSFFRGQMAGCIRQYIAAGVDAEGFSM